MSDEPTLAQLDRDIDTLEGLAADGEVSEALPQRLRSAVEALREQDRRIAELEAKVRRYEAMEPCGGNCDFAWRHR